jgi:hypothetical protein
MLTLLNELYTAEYEKSRTRSLFSFPLKGRK